MLGVYIWCRPDGSPFYVGMGSMKRAWWRKERNPETLAVVRQIEDDGGDVRVVFLHCWDRAEARRLERRFIQYYGRLDLGTGPLTNRNGGGGGVDRHTAEARAKMARRKTPEHRRKLSEAKRGRRRDKEWRWLPLETPESRLLTPPTA